MNGVMRFTKKGKLNHRFIGPFEILSRVGEVAYNLASPPSFSIMHPKFHFSMLLKYMSDESYVLSLDSVELDPYLSFGNEPIAILDRPHFCKGQPHKRPLLKRPSLLQMRLLLSDTRVYGKVRFREPLVPCATSKRGFAAHFRV
ncbi:hypothetical protein MTR67_003403 [Solanum verrucosum]|uniref:Tf2-1-like SH3-like domain-containing protein n=1 Tax=Solanum verrucosum TaxID=315347 RepID=A0AAF0PS32_SOLVR|nr:hypothetical protein MTR67_003403 [Solanum verrucosum]